MILADTSVWVDHLRSGDSTLSGLLEEGQVVTHPYVTGELASGNLNKREEVLGLLRSLESAGQPDEEEILFFIERKALNGKGLGYIDVSLLASCILHGVTLYTRDRSLAGAAQRLGIAFIR